MNNNEDINSRLFDACVAENVDIRLIEELLRKGADPLATFNKYDDIVLEQLFCLASDDEMPFLDSRVPELVKLFIRYGMDINKIPDLGEDDAVTPLWSMAVWCTPNAIKTLNMLLDSGLKALELDQFISHFVDDAAYISGDIEDDYYRNYLICG